MKRLTRNGVIAVAAVSGAMGITMPAHADSGAAGTAAGSPGAASGNLLQLPVDVPVNLCGDTVDVVGLLNPAFGNTCVSDGGSAGKARSARSGERGGGERSGGERTGGGHRTDASGTSGAGATGDAVGSGGILSGNGLKLPVDLPLTATGNSVNVVGVGNPSFGNEAQAAPEIEVPEVPEPPVVEPPAPQPPADVPVPGPRTDLTEVTEVTPAGEPVTALASTGTGETLPAALGGAALLLGGVVLYRRFRPAATR